MSIFNDLNAKQLEAVKYTEGPLLILAGAGSGKTRVLVHRIAYLIEQCGVSPHNILAITFTNKAANEMRERISLLIGEKSKKIWAKTFHSTCLQILRYNIEKTGLKENFVIYDTTDQNSIIKRILKQLNLNNDLIKPSSILHTISNMKNEFADIFEAIQIYQQREYLSEQIIQAIQEYQQTLISNNAVDFDDIICYVVKLLKNNQDILEYYQERFKYIHVDEYQDTNKIQYEFVNLLARKYQNICVVGDDDQSIYEWRGANLENILNFEKDYRYAHVIKLEENYRSTKKILNIANSVIANNALRKEKTLWTNNDAGEKIVYYSATDDRDEGFFIARRITDLYKTKKYKFNDFAVLIRTTAQFRSLEECFLKNNIPYRIYGGIRFFQRKEIKDILAYLSVISNPNDALNIKRIINIPKRGIGEQTWNKIISFNAQQDNQTLMDSLIDSNLKVSNKIKSELNLFYQMINSARQLSIEIFDLVSLIQFILEETKYIQYLNEKNTLSSEISTDYIEEFISIAQEFDDRKLSYETRNLSTFLEEISLYTDLDQNNHNGDAVNIMTMHSSKGLEFPVVFVAGFEENIFPHIRTKNEDGIEEERRLCYVAFTRAKNRLYITSSGKRILHGKFMYNLPSSFLSEMDKESYVDITKKGYLPNEYSIEKNYNEENEIYSIGDKVSHSIWKEGIVVSIDTNDPSKITVAFTNEGIKTISTKYAPITKC